LTRKSKILPRPGWNRRILRLWSREAATIAPGALSIPDEAIAPRFRNSSREPRLAGKFQPIDASRFLSQRAMAFQGMIPKSRKPVFEISMRKQNGKRDEPGSTKPDQTRALIVRSHHSAAICLFDRVPPLIAPACNATSVVSPLQQQYSSRSGHTSFGLDTSCFLRGADQ
jgi:hypothetical protein